jgi:hypothetical protein
MLIIKSKERMTVLNRYFVLLFVPEIIMNNKTNEIDR